MQQAISDNIIVFDPRRASKRVRPSPDIVLRVIGRACRADGKWVTRCTILSRQLKSSAPEISELESGGLGGVDSKDSLLGANQIQGCFWGGRLGCDGPFGI
jgi:hypothetical protein